MKFGFYPKLAWDGMRKNRRVYIPYILTGAVMVMMYYILSFLKESPTAAQMPGWSVLPAILSMGYGVIAVFSLLFLFYTNSFLIRQRYREFGLYNVLGMDKRNIGRIMVWECLMVGVLAIAFGMAAGIALSKAAELILMNLLHLDVNFQLSIGRASLWQTPLVYGVIYLLILLNSIVKVWRSRPLELMRSSQTGERIPKRIWLYALFGVILLAFAYYLSVSIEEPLTALAWFFAAVILVIIATYALFMAGSVVLCKLLQKNKSYYYQANHFVSVSSMAYRMRRNGAGLASICILLTMVLVMISSTVSLYIGSEDTIQRSYPNGVNITVTFDQPDGITDESIQQLLALTRDASGAEEIPAGTRAAEIPGLFTAEGVTIDYSGVTDFSMSTYDNVGYLSVVSLDDYNSQTGANETLAEDECLLYCLRIEHEGETFTMEGGETYRVKKILDDFCVDGDSSAMIIPTVYMVVPDLAAFIEPVKDLKNNNGAPMMMYDWRTGFELETPELEIAAANAVREAFRSADIAGKFGGYSYSIESREANREDYFQTFGSLFFLGIMLSIVFLMAAVLIIYYKQISEGYEDRSRFDIMQKVGMTKNDIRRSINSQVLTVFFSPLLFAGVHLCFAFPFLWKMLMLLNLYNKPLIIAVSAICFVIFGLLYALVYKITSNAYYTIVSGRKE